MRGLSLSRTILAAAALALAVLAVLAVLDRLGENAHEAARQALLMRATALAQTELAPGSVLPCVDGTAGEVVGNACEKQIFASAQSTAAAVAYMGARIDLLREAAALAKRGDKRVHAALASTRRAVALDRYGIAAHVLAERDGCTAAKCAVFAALDNADTLKANLRAQTFDQYVSRYAADWRTPTPDAAKAPAVSALPPAAPAAQETAHAAPPLADKTEDQARAEATPPGAPMAHKPVSSRWVFPSADSIPAVSIMNPEPKLPKAIAEQLNRDTARKTAIERRKEGKDPAAGLSTQGSAHKESKDKQAKDNASKASKGSKDKKESKDKESKSKKEAETKQQEPGTPLQLTR